MTNKQSKLVFVIGLSGVGKTHIISNFIKNHNNFLHLKASSLIKQGLLTQDSEKIRKVSDKEIKYNQGILVKKLDEYKINNKKIILDGHIIIDNEEKITPIPLEIIKRISPKIIILVQAPPEQILSHIDNDKSRIRPQRSINQVKENQDLQEKIAKEYCSTLNINLERVDCKNNNIFENLVINNV